LAYERGLLKGPDLNVVQEQILTILLILRRRRDYELEESRFEQQLSIHRPESYQKYLDLKEDQEDENLGYHHIVWKTPDTVEEAAEIMAAVQQGHRQIEDDPTFDEDLAALSQLGSLGIDINLLGDENG